MGRQYKPKFCPLKLYYYQLIEGVENGRVVGSTENRIAETARASSGSTALPRRPAGTIGTISAFRNQTLGTHIAGRPKQVRADLALFEGGDEDALGATDQEPRQIGLAHPERKMPHVLAVAGEHVEGVVLNILVTLSGIKRSKSDRPSTPRMTASHQ